MDAKHEQTGLSEFPPEYIEAFNASLPKNLRNGIPACLSIPIKPAEKTVSRFLLGDRLYARCYLITGRSKWRRT